MINALYICGYNASSLGAKRKVLSQIKNLNKCVDSLYPLVVINGNEGKDELLDLAIPNLKIVSLKSDFEIPKIFYRRFFRNYQDLYKQLKFILSMNKRMKKELKTYNNNFDIAYVRYNSTYLFLKKLGKKTKLIVEHNSKELDEIKYRMDSGEDYRLYYYVEKYYAKINLRNVYLGVAVSQEIKEVINKRRPNYINFVWNNPLDVSLYKPREFKEQKGVINLAVMIGTYAAWHGLDLLVDSIKAYTGNHKIVLHYIGLANENIKEIIDDIEVVYYGKCDIEEQSKIYSYCHGAIDSLAHFRIGMKVSPSLKSKEYFAHGIPFISGSKIAMEEADSRVSKYYLHVNVENEGLFMEDVISYLENICSDASHSTKMHQIVDERFNMVKEFKKVIDICAV